MSFSDFEHSLIEFYKNTKAQSAYTVACSGGLDSVALLHAIVQIRPIFKYDLKVLHVHHGVSPEKKEQSAFRDKAQDFVRSLAEEASLEFLVFRSDIFLETEDDCRNFRLEAYKKSKNVLTAHHKDDFLETLVLRMIRGSGSQGLSGPFKETNLKPFLNLFEQSQIRDYAQSHQLEWCEDPSNQNTDPLRNWIRNEWLPQLDNKIGKEGFEKSLMLISQALTAKDEIKHEEGVTFDSDEKGFFRIEDWLILDRFQKQSMIAHILLKVRKTGYTHGQIEEVVKQLDQVKKNITFRSGKLEWSKSESKVAFRLDL